MNTMKTIAIDPGYERVGIAVLEKRGGEKEQLLHSRCFVTSAKLSFPERLRLIGETIEQIIDEYKPSALAIEKLYFNTNQKTGILVSEARGMMLYVAKSRDLHIFEYTPLQIKQAITGDGRGDKRQIIDMIHRLIDIHKPIKYDDEYDAIAIGLTCLACEYRLQNGSIKH